MAVTQFEPADARKCFPCWDEPACKVCLCSTFQSKHTFLSILRVRILNFEFWNRSVGFQVNKLPFGLLLRC